MAEGGAAESIHNVFFIVHPYFWPSALWHLGHCREDITLPSFDRYFGSKVAPISASGSFHCAPWPFTAFTTDTVKSTELSMLFKCIVPG